MDDWGSGSLTQRLDAIEEERKKQKFKTPL
jgi:hypothetical protein